MGMTPEDFFYSFVESNYWECEKKPGCVRRAFNAAVSASHLADHYWKYYQKNDPSKIQGFKKIGMFVEELSTKTNGCFRDIRSIANAYKHLYTSSVYSSISSTGAIESIEFADEDSEVKDIEETWIEKKSEYRVIYTRKDGNRVEFLPNLKTFIDYWSKNYH